MKIILSDEKKFKLHTYIVTNATKLKDLAMNDEETARYVSDKLGFEVSEFHIYKGKILTQVLWTSVKHKTIAVDNAKVLDQKIDFLEERIKTLEEQIRYSISHGELNSVKGEKSN